MTDGNFQSVIVREKDYDLDGVLPVDGDVTVPKGTSLLVSGPSMLGKRDIALKLLAHGEGQDEPAVIVTPDDSAERVMDRFRSFADSSGEVYVVDCSGTGTHGSFDDTERAFYLSGPDDLTGIGISFVKSTRTMGETASDGVRIGLLSLSTILRYASIERTFNFLHVMTNRFAAAGYLGVATFDPTLHDDQTANTITTLFDAVVEVEEDDDGRRRGRIKGLPDVPREWRSF